MPNDLSSESSTAARRIGLGCMGLSWAYEDPSIEHAKKLEFLREAVARGVDFFDTSDQYGPFTNEALVGEALETLRNRVSIATKGGLVVDEHGKTSRDGRPEHLSAALEASLLRLRTHQVDLYQLHRVDPAVPIERSWEAMATLVERGLTASIGLSEVSVREIERAQSIYPVASVQSELSLWSRDALDEVLPYCEENGIAFIAFSPLGRGFLTGALSSPEDLPEGDWRLNHPRYQAHSMAANIELVEIVRACAADSHSTPAQVALAWVLAQGSHVTAIPGTQRIEYLLENLGAERLALTPEWMSKLDALPAAIGGRS
ncbi:aldo/keto reductase [Pseudoclavibacter sp. RFBG4]|uniref:aldo/keto reductase n=1 Tax=unclassified Pseudoclavibacter TaxID=2615177 RepID=UPI000CE7A467|nr:MULTISPECIES: aldo/keto reductase [unclassified Pseudoclavibacter]MBF4549138.1 aldo/keto reductase [Pseudoclavibacter sp. VKM Ac-2888]PPG33871.1 aldo/keto reductase [Pseudoclavibacter sp. RFBG4]